MDLKDIVALKGESGLFKIVGGNDKMKIVEALSDQRRKPITETHKVTPLMLVSLYSIKGDDENILIIDIFKTLKEQESAGNIINPKDDPKKVAAFFKSLFPDYDEERVYPSIISKVLSWYNILKDKINFEDSEEENKDSDNPDSESNGNSGGGK